MLKKKYRYYNKIFIIAAYAFKIQKKMSHYNVCAKIIDFMKFVS